MQSKHDRLSHPEDDGDDIDPRECTGLRLTDELLATTPGSVFALERAERLRRWVRGEA